jgi:hypothetical protein
MGGGAPIPGPPIPCTAPGGRIPMAPAGGPPIIGGPPGLPLCVGAPIWADRASSLEAHLATGHEWIGRYQIWVGQGQTQGREDAVGQ